MIEMKYGITFTDQFGDIAYYAVDEEVRAKIEDLCEEYVKQQKAEKKGIKE